MPAAFDAVPTVFTAARAPLDRLLLGANVALALSFAAVILSVVVGVRPPGWLDVPVAVILFVWLFATPLLAVLGGLRAHTSGWRRALAAHSVFASAWLVGMVASLFLTLVHA
ncbi:MAG: hypothetical protein AB8I08_08515 [Sandaracinaceae bacterium]